MVILRVRGATPKAEQLSLKKPSQIRKESLLISFSKSVYFFRERGGVSIGRVNAG